MSNGFQSNTVLNPITCPNRPTIIEADPLSKMTGHNNTSGEPDITISHKAISTIRGLSACELHQNKISVIIKGVNLHYKEPKQLKTLLSYKTSLYPSQWPHLSGLRWEKVLWNMKKPYATKYFCCFSCTFLTVKIYTRPCTKPQSHLRGPRLSPPIKHHFPSACKGRSAPTLFPHRKIH